MFCADGPPGPRERLGPPCPRIDGSDGDGPASTTVRGLYPFTRVAAGAAPPSVEIGSAGRCPPPRSSTDETTAGAAGAADVTTAEERFSSATTSKFGAGGGTTGMADGCRSPDHRQSPPNLLVVHSVASRGGPRQPPTAQPSADGKRASPAPLLPPAVALPKSAGGGGGANDRKMT